MTCCCRMRNMISVPGLGSSPRSARRTCARSSSLVPRVGGRSTSPVVWGRMQMRNAKRTGCGPCRRWVLRVLWGSEFGSRLMVPIEHQCSVFFGIYLYLRNFVSPAADISVVAPPPLTHLQDPYSTPFVLTTSPAPTSPATLLVQAVRIATASALNALSARWWSLSPYVQPTCSVTSAACAKLCSP